MAFGKIAVRMADGDILEYELTKPTTSVGRQPGNDIVLPTSAVSRYHATLDVAEGSVYLVDLGTVNGSFVNDQQIEANGRISLNDGDVITLGDIELLFSAPEARSGSKRAVLKLNPEARVIEAPGIPYRLIMDDPQQSVAPGARLQITLTMESLADHEFPVTIELRGLDPDWAKSNRKDALLEPGVQTQAMISVRPPRSSQTRPGIYPLTVRVSLTEDPSKSLEAVAEVDVVGYAGLGIAIRNGRSDDLYHLAVQNQGNVPMKIQLDGYQRDHLLSFRYDPAQFALQPGQTQQITLRVSPVGGRPFSAGKAIPFAVVAQSVDSAGFQAPVLATYTLHPTWPAWLIGAGVPLIAGAALVLLLIIALLFAFGIFSVPFIAPRTTPTAEVTLQAISSLAAPSPGPTWTPVLPRAAEIANFSVSNEEVIYQTQGTITIIWDATDATEVTLVGPDGKEIPLSAANQSAQRYEIPISDLSFGPNTFTLTVTGRDGLEKSRSLVARAIAPICTIRSGAVAYSLPDPKSEPAPQFASDQAVIVGRTDDSQWVRIAYNDLDSLTIRGWLPAANIACGPGSPPIDNYVVVEGVQSLSPDVTPSATP